MSIVPHSSRSGKRAPNEANAIERSTLSDLLAGARRFELWIALSHDDVRFRFKRTALGLAWITVSYLVFVAAKVIIFGAIAPQPTGWFLLYVASGFLAWTFLSGSILDACNVFVTSENWILGLKLPFSLYIFQNVFREIIFFIYSSIIVFVAFIILRWDHAAQIVWVLPAFFIYIFNAILVNMYLGPLCTRYRDITQIIQAGLRVMFFLTPLVWTPEQVGEVANWLWWNPFVYMIDIFRSPLVEGIVPIQSWVVVGLITVINLGLGWAAFSWARNKIPYWF